MKHRLLTITLCIFCSLLSEAQIINNWRGPLRDGVYPESGLLKSWPQNGPEMLWAFENLGSGYTSPSFAGGKIYITGAEDSIGYVYVLNEAGALQSKIKYGPEFIVSYPGSRTSTLIDGNLLYKTSGHGVLYCIDLTTQKVKWTKDYFNEYDGKNIRFGFTEGLLIKDNMIYCQPGGVKYNMVALDKLTGKEIWVSGGKGDLSAYCSPLLITHNNREMLVNMMAENIIALDPKTGTLLWSHPYKNNRSIHPNAPLYKEGMLYCFSGYGKGGIMLRINEAGNGVTEVWADTKLDNQMGGTVVVNGRIYGSGQNNPKWTILDWNTGQILGEATDPGKGNVIYADGLLYIYSEKGELALAEPTATGIKVISKTAVTKGTEQHWAHPVIRNGVLYVRHGSAMMAYKIK
ncbi:MAG: PQQ-binding-like beta-propeller repeat protein [Bacteroidales bacterium]